VNKRKGPCGPDPSPFLRFGVNDEVGGAVHGPLPSRPILEEKERCLEKPDVLAEMRMVHVVCSLVRFNKNRIK